MNTAIHVHSCYRTRFHYLIIRNDKRTVLLWPECPFGKLHMLSISQLRNDSEQKREEWKRGGRVIDFCLTMYIIMLIEAQNTRGTNSSKSSHDEWIMALYSIMTCIKFWLHCDFSLIIIIIFLCLHSQFTIFKKHTHKQRKKITISLFHIETNAIWYLCVESTVT